MFAPILYKSMTFVLIESYLSIELRDSLLKNFIQLFKNHPNIPIAILCEPLLKQIMINLEKQDSVVQRNIGNILQPTADQFTLNTTDFELFMAIASHPKINAQVAVPLIEIVSIVARKSIIFTRVSLKLLLMLLSRFENNTQVFQVNQQIISDLIKIITDQDAAKIELYNELKENPKLKAKRKGSIEHGGMNGGVNTRTLNAKYNGQTSNEKVDDKIIMAMINPRMQQDQSAYYMGIKTNERLVVNLLQCLIQTGIKVLAEFSREKLLDAYLKSEKNLNFSNKGILYLLQFFEKDVTKMLQFSKQQMAKERTLKLEQKKVLKEQAQMIEKARLGALNRSQDAYAEFNASSDINLMNMQINDSVDFNSMRKRKPPISPRGNAVNNGYLEPPKKNVFKTKKMSLISPIIHHDKNKSLLRYGTRDGDDFSRENSRGEDSSIKKLYYPDTVKTRKRKSVNMVKSYTYKNDFYQKEDGQIRLYEINEDSSAEQHKYLQWVKDWLKLYKAMFQKYADGAIGKSKPSGTFGDIVDQKKHMNLASVFSFLQDFKIQRVEAKRDDIKRIIQLINIKQESNVKTTSDIDLEGFIEFNLQLGYHLYNEVSILPSNFLPMLFERFKEVSMSTRTPLFQRLLENPNAPPIGDQHTITYLTEQVNKYPEAELPSGYIKVPVDRIREVHGPDPAIYQQESQQLSVMILDDLFEDIFGLPLLEPMIRYEKQWQVKHENKKPNPKPRYNEIGEKHRFKSYMEQEEEKLKSIKQQNTRQMIGKRISLDSENPVRSSNSIAVKKRPFGSQSPEVRRPVYRAKYNKYDRPEPISNALRSELAGVDPEKDNHLRESAYLLDEMLGAVSKGKRQLSYRSPAVAGRVNRVQEDRVAKALRDEEEKFRKDEKAIQRQAYLKQKLEKYQSEVKHKMAVKTQVQKETIEKQRKDEEKKQRDKEKYYQELQQDFEHKRLPEIGKNKAAETALKAQLREEKKQKRENANRRIEKNTEALRKQFTQAAKAKDLAEAQSVDQQRSLRKDASIKRFDTMSKQPMDPQKQAEINRMRLAKSSNYSKENRELSKLGGHQKNQAGSKARLGLDKRSAGVEKIKSNGDYQLTINSDNSGDNIKGRKDSLKKDRDRSPRKTRTLNNKK